MTPTYHTPEQLRTQANIAKRAMEFDIAQLAKVKDADWIPAKEYGEETRQNHIRVIEMRIAHYAKRIEVITMALPYGEVIL
jgi:hypothetical protein